LTTMTTWPISACITGATNNDNDDDEGNRKNRAPKNDEDDGDLAPAPSLASNCSQGGSRVLTANTDNEENTVPPQVSTPRCVTTSPS
jgi:hypothetical protein